MRCELVKQTKLPRGKIGQATWRILNILYYIILYWRTSKSYVAYFLWAQQLEQGLR